MSALRRLLRLGATDGTSPLAVGHVVFVNGLALLAASTTGLTIAIGLALATMTPASLLYASLAGIMPPLAVLWLNARRWHTALAEEAAAEDIVRVLGCVRGSGP